MNPCNAVIKSWGIRESESYSRCLELWLELELQNGGGVCYTVYGVYTQNWQKNQFAYGVKRVMEIAGVDDLKYLAGKPVRAKFKEDGSLGDVIIGIGHFLKDDWFVLRENQLWNREAKPQKQKVFQILEEVTTWDGCNGSNTEENIVGGVYSSYALAQANLPKNIKDTNFSVMYSVIESELDPTPEKE